MTADTARKKKVLIENIAKKFFLCEDASAPTLLRFYISGVF